MTDEKGATVDLFLVYMGRRGDGAAMRYVWLRVPDGFRGAVDGETDDSKGWHFKKPLYTCKPGTIVKFKGEEKDKDNATVYGQQNRGANAPEYIGVWLNKAQRDRWIIADEQAGLAKRRASKAAQEQRAKMPLDALEPFRLAYLRATPAAQAEILALVIQTITEFKPPVKPKGKRQ